MNDYWEYQLQQGLDGATNMELDETMARQTALDGRSRLRLYSWSPWTVSLGHNQKIESIDAEALNKYGYDLVRRPTGGRAVLHADEITYAVAMPILTDGIHETYRKINHALARGLKMLGARDVEFARSQPDFRQHYADGIDSDNCFSTSALSELMWHGRKLCGSAQRRYDSVLLQHGSLLLDEGHLNIVKLLAAFSTDPTRQEKLRVDLQTRTVTLREILGEPLPSFDKIANALREGFEEEFAVSIIDPNLDSDTHQIVSTVTHPLEPVLPIVAY